MDILQTIKTRRSVRRFKKEKISGRVVKEILEAGRWAPSGLNNQPWKFLVLVGLEKNLLAGCTTHPAIIKGADKIILVFLDKNLSYNCEKDLMAVGASIQNMLLYIHSKRLGACWLGGILNKRKKIARLLKTPKNLKLKAILALGKPTRIPKKTSRKPLKDLILKRLQKTQSKKDLTFHL